MNDKPNFGQTAAAFIGTSAAILAIGLLNVWSEFSTEIKTRLTLHAGIGPYSGKVLFGLLIGGAVWILADVLLLRMKNGNIVRWTFFFTLAVGAGMLMVFTPFLRLLLGE
ncbi:hypothetical protein A3F28_02595 [Candidatus Uhrbacteria bacterium RIFCSPHIGHO2_12_FULL_57_11]|uniref:Uncharacterized protein n=2 Tax=Candidatus Uhriibacteriota TaxID=1752732 RepID=A0A1F7UKL6_9BACT|nr:MAG: hypothetical protein A3D72_02630 [Candidatus Uhrbacteria bacterium RIFCSPHIGHO2_02_FULL_57_19]OGL78830.1 MAG: hypothetical protein A3F28_02595 [Candidatus Uhrbacteria bacterium RIFCSPHIGHO2_12_FULL_57_11]